LVAENNIDFEYTAQIEVVTLNTNEAIKFIRQKNKKNHLKEKQNIRIDKMDVVNFIIDRLKSDNLFLMRKSIDKNIYADLNKIIKGIFKPNKEIGNAIEISNLIKIKINKLIESNKLYDSYFSKEEWLIYIYLIYKSKQNGFDFMTVVNSIDIDSLSKEVEYKNKVSIKHYRLIDKLINEVIL
jgi:hypothetical protein